jgi:flagellar biosynthesis protein FlhF
MSEQTSTPTLRLKSYFSGTVEAAMALARQELGEDALLVNARPATPETRSLGAYEVVFGITGERAAPTPPPLPPPAPSTSAADLVRRLADDVAELRREIVELRRPAAPPSGAPPDTYSTDATLGSIGARAAGRAVVMLVGPPGSGKTTALVKLAARYGVHAGKRTQILTTDVFRVAAAEQLQTLAAIMGAPCDIVEPAGLLARALEEHDDKELILIDTPGLALGEMASGIDLARAASTYDQIETHLVLPASMKSSDLARIADAYSLFRPNKLLFTRLDETLDCRSLVEEAARTRTPISFLTAGQRIPDDIEPATRRRLTQLLNASEAGHAPSLAKGATA